MSYLEFLGLFIVFPTVLLVALAVRKRETRQIPGLRLRRHWTGVAILAGIAFVWTTPWDNFLVARQVWNYGPDRVIATIGFVPVEEYLFFLLQPALVGAFLYFLVRPSLIGSTTWRQKQTVLRVGGGLVTLAVIILAAVLLRFQPTTYLGLILIWFVPPVGIQWCFDPMTIIRQWRVIVAGTALPTLYLSLADSFALADGIWEVARSTATGVAFGNLPLEEFLFFGITSLLLAQGLVLWHSLPVGNSSK